MDETAVTAEAHQGGGDDGSTRNLAPIQYPPWTPSERERTPSSETRGSEQTGSLHAPEHDFAPALIETPHALQLPSPSQPSVDGSISSPPQGRLESPLYVEPAPNLITPRYSKLLHHFKTTIGWPWVSLTLLDVAAFGSHLTLLTVRHGRPGLHAGVSATSIFLSTASFCNARHCSNPPKSVNQRPSDRQCLGIRGRQLP